MKSVYAIIRTGVYMQGVFGIYDDKALAIEAAKECIGLEDDDYHEFHVVLYHLNMFANKVWDLHNWLSLPGYRVALIRRTGDKIEVIEE